MRPVNLLSMKNKPKPKPKKKPKKPKAMTLAELRRRMQQHDIVGPCALARLLGYSPSTPCRWMTRKQGIDLGSAALIRERMPDL